MRAAATVTDPAGAPAAEFEAIYHSNLDSIWSFLERLGVPDSALEDAVQDVFVVAHRQLPGFRGASSLKTWLHGIAHKVAKDYRRREQRKGAWVELEPTLADERGSPQELAAHRQQLQAVLRLLDEMDDTHRTVFVLTDLQGFTAPEIAEVMGSSVNTVSSRLRAARQRFNDLVASRFPGEPRGAR